MDISVLVLDHNLDGTKRESSDGPAPIKQLKELTPLLQLSGFGYSYSPYIGCELGLEKYDIIVAHPSSLDADYIQQHHKIPKIPKE